jgi:hypothetical protein
LNKFYDISISSCTYLAITINRNYLLPVIFSTRCAINAMHTSLLTLIGIHFHSSPLNIKICTLNIKFNFTFKILNIEYYYYAVVLCLVAIGHSFSCEDAVPTCLAAGGNCSVLNTMYSPPLSYLFYLPYFINSCIAHISLICSSFCFYNALCV